MRLVLVDLDNTLIDRAGAFRAWAHDFVRARALPHGAVDRLLEEDRDGQVPRVRVFEMLRSEFGVPESVATLERDYRRDFVAKFSLDASVRDALLELRARSIRIVIVTNGPRTQRDKISRTGLDALVDACVVSEDVGARKPDLRMFRAGADAVGTTLSPDHWMVGDHPVADVGGARDAGLRSAWIRRGRQWSEGGFAPTLSVDHFAAAATHILDALG